jgi:hypothetical protein
MTQAMPPPPLPLPVTTATRRGGLMAWGIVLIAIGALAAIVLLVGVFIWLSDVETSLAQTPAAARARASAARRSGATPAPRPPTITAATAAGMLMALAAAASMVWVGIASCLARRWVRPVVVAVSGIVVAFGLMNFLGMWLTLPGLLDAMRTPGTRGPAAMNPLTFVLMFAIRAAVVLAVGACVPYLLLRYYRDPRTAQLLDYLDPRITWLDRRPIPVLAWAMLCALMALSTAVRLAQPVLPAFTTVLRGAPAIIGLSVIAVLLAWGTWLCVRVDRFGWMLTFLVLVALRVSTAMFLWTGGAVADLSFDGGGGAAAATAAGSMTRASRPALPADWVPQVLTTVELLALAAFGLYVARFFPAGYRVGVLSRARDPNNGGGGGGGGGRT